MYISFFNVSASVFSFSWRGRVGTELQKLRKTENANIPIVKWHLLPFSLILTSASLHDSQAAIPLAQMTAERVTSLYDLMDAAYDAGTLHNYIESLGHVALIDSKPRSGKKKIMDPAQEVRYNQRTSVERFFSMLKDNHGGKHVRVRGA